MLYIVSYRGYVEHIGFCFRMISQQYFTNIGNLLLKFQQESFLCDTVLISKDKRIEVHGVLLAAASPVLKCAIDANISLGTDSRHHIGLPDLDSDLLEIIVDFIYSGNLVLPKRFSNLTYLQQLITVFDDLELDRHHLNDCVVKFKRYLNRLYLTDLNL